MKDTKSGKKHWLLWILGCIAITTVIILSLYTDTASQEIEVFPLPDNHQPLVTGDRIACLLQYDLSNSEKRIDVYVEVWNKDQMTCKEHLATYKNKGICEISAEGTPTNEWLWRTDSSTSKTCRTNATPGFTHSCLTYQDVKEISPDIYSESGLIVLSLAPGDLEKGILAVDCRTLNEHETYFSFYEELQLVRIEVNER